jgi:phosphoesterase RecJ-like protein
LRIDLASKESIRELQVLFERSTRVCVVGHRSPDGDCIASAFALAGVLSRLGKTADIAMAGKIPYNYDTFFDKSAIMTSDDGSIYDAAIAVDCASPERLEPFRGLFERAATRAVIDHHVSNRGFGDVCVIDTVCSSTCELIFRIARAIGAEIDKEIAEYLYIGILTDSGKFRYPSVTPNTHRAAGDLLEYGIDPASIYRRIYHDKPVGVAIACGMAMSRLKVHDGGRFALTAISQKIARENAGDIDEIDGIIDWLLNIRGVEVACVLKEIGAKEVKVSLRSVSGYRLQELAKRYNGGGHETAAGFSLRASPEDAEAIVIKIYNEWIKR